MIKSLRLLNVFLSLIAFGLAGVLVHSIGRDWFLEPGHPANPVANQESPKATPVPSAALQLTSRLRPVAEFDSILRGTLFKNPDAEAQQKAAVPVVPLPALIGTIFFGAEAKAILRERGREEIYGVGERVGAGTIAAIDAERIIIDLGNRRAEVLMKSALKWVQPPPSVQGGEVSPSKMGALSRAPAQEKAAERQVQGQSTRQAERLRRTGRALELQQPMREVAN